MTKFKSQRDQYIYGFILKPLVISSWISIVLCFIINVLILLYLAHSIESIEFSIIDNYIMINFEDLMILFLIIATIFGIGYYICRKMIVFDLDELKVSFVFDSAKLVYSTSYLILGQLIILFLVPSIVPAKGLVKTIIDLFYLLLEYIIQTVYSAFSLENLIFIVTNDLNAIILPRIFIELLSIDIYIFLMIVPLSVMVKAIFGFISSWSMLRKSFIAGWTQQIDENIIPTLITKNEHDIIHLNSIDDIIPESCYKWELHLQDAIDSLNVIEKSSEKLDIQTSVRLIDEKNRKSSLLVECLVTPRTFGYERLLMQLKIMPHLTGFDRIWWKLLGLQGIVLPLYERYFRVYPPQPRFRLEIINVIIEKADQKQFSLLLVYRLRNEGDGCAKYVQIKIIKEEPVQEVKNPPQIREMLPLETKSINSTLTVQLPENGASNSEIKLINKVFYKDEDGNTQSVLFEAKVRASINSRNEYIKPIELIQLLDKTPDTIEVASEKFISEITRIKTSLSNIVIKRYTSLLNRLLELKISLERDLPPVWQKLIAEKHYQNRLFDHLDYVPEYHNRIDKEAKRGENRCDIIIDGEIIIEIKFLAESVKPEFINLLIDKHEVQISQYLRERDKVVGFLVIFSNYPRLEVDPPHLDDIGFSIAEYKNVDHLIVGILIRCGLSSAASNRKKLI